MPKYTGNKPNLDYTFYKRNIERTQSYPEKVLSSSKKREINFDSRKSKTNLLKKKQLN
tara:strand:- start:19 stop:192 length:174 start_codon:yes stop_codon:yes gene_type:complete